MQPFCWGLMLGLVLVILLWRAAYKDKRYLRREIERLKLENGELQGHLNTQLKINAKGQEAMQAELAGLREQNENLRVNLNTLQQKAGRVELRRLEVMEAAVCVMREQAPGFASVWEKALRSAEDEMQEAEGGLKRLIRKVIPGFRATPSLTSSDVESAPVDVE